MGNTMISALYLIVGAITSFISAYFLGYPIQDLSNTYNLTALFNALATF